MKPGFTRLNLAYFADDAEIERILGAIDFIASDGWRFLPLVRSIESVTSSKTLRLLLSTNTMSRRQSGDLGICPLKNKTPWLMPIFT